MKRQNRVLAPNDFCKDFKKFGNKLYLLREEMTRAAINAAMRWDSRGLLYSFIGPGKYSMTEYEKVKKTDDPLDIPHYLVTMGVSANHTFIIDKIQEIIGNNLEP